MEAATRYQESRRITLLGACKNASLAFLKILFGITGHSHALFADGIHSLSDLLIDGLVVIATRFGSKAADHDHPYGHGRIETAAIVVFAAFFTLAGLVIIFNAGREILGLQLPTRPSFYVFFVALLSIIVNEVLYHHTRHVGERLRSNILVMNAWHHRSDSATSVAVLLGVGLAWLGYGRFDAIAAALVGVMIIRMAWHFGWHSIRELVDTGLDDAIVAQIKRLITSVPGVCALHQLRTRSVGGRVFIDMHILVNPMLSVSEGHFIGHQVHLHLLKEMPDLADVTVHVDPEDDEIVEPSLDLPVRKELCALLRQRWQGVRITPEKVVTNYLDDMRLHYLSGKLHIELYLPAEPLAQDEKDDLLKALQVAVADQPKIASIKLWWGSL